MIKKRFNLPVNTLIIAKSIILPVVYSQRRRYVNNVHWTFQEMCLISEKVNGAHIFYCNYISELPMDAWFILVYLVYCQVFLGYLEADN